MTVKVRCDDKAKIYIDGGYVGGTSRSTEIWTADSISDSAQVIAVECENTGQNAAGLIASFSNGLTTDSTWRCTGDSFTGWQSVTFDDQRWLSPYVAQNNSGRTVRWPEDPNFPADAKWIWKRAYEGLIETPGNSYCRGRLRECGYN